MSEEGGDLPLVEVQVEVLHCHFPIRIDLVEVIDGHSCNEADEMMKVQVREDFTITEKDPTRAFSWLKAPTGAFTFKTLLIHYAKRTLTPR